MKKIHVSLGNKSYDVLVESGLIDHTGEMLLPVAGKCRAAVVTDDNVAPLYLNRVVKSLENSGIAGEGIVFPHGEKTKSLESLEKLYGFLAEKKITRSDVVISLGGGVIGDLAGLAAATYLRGISFVQIPTSLLSQVDSSVGGKVAVDLPQGKNLVGAFHQPRCVICDPQVLPTLSDKYWWDGMGEVIKYGCIGDEELFRLIEENICRGRSGLMGIIDTIILRSVQQKADVVSQDEHDTGIRMVLNFGHTIGHAIEACQKYSGLSHGEAVAVGMNVMTEITEKNGITQPGTQKRIENLLKAAGLPCKLPQMSRDDLIDAMLHDKKMLDNSLNVIVLEKIGKCCIIRTDTGFFKNNL